MNRPWIPCSSGASGNGFRIVSLNVLSPVLAQKYEHLYHCILFALIDSQIFSMVASGSSHTRNTRTPERRPLRAARG